MRKGCVPLPLIVAIMTWVAPATASRAQTIPDRAQTTAGMVEANMATLHALEARMDANYRALVEKLRNPANPTTKADREKYLEPQIRALEKSQHAWVAYRVAQCDFIASGTEGGSEQPIERSWCDIVLTKHRADELRDELTCLGSEFDCVWR